MLNENLTQPPMAVGNRSSVDYQRMMLEWKDKYVRALEVQSTIEGELEQLTDDKRALNQEVANLRQQKADCELEVAQVTKQLINGQAQYLDQMSAMSEEVSKVRTRNRSLELEKEALQSQIEEYQALKATEQRPKSPAPRELLNQELMIRHEQLKTQITQVEEVNSRLQQENDAFQFLLAENTITGESVEITGSTLDAELGVFDEQINDDCQDPKSDPSSLKFELRSAQNYIQALKLSLESLVERLLENKEFEKALEQTIGHRRISAFTERKRQALAYTQEQLVAAPHEQEYWSKLFSPKKRGKSTSSQLTTPASQAHRTFSLSVDEQLDDFSEAGSTQSSSNRSSRSNRSSPSQRSTLVNEIVLPKRPATVTQTGLRKFSIS